MNQHQQIMAEFEKQYSLLRDAVIVGPDALAYGAYRHFVGDRQVEPHVQYSSLEHMKNMARKFLAVRNDPDDDDNEVHRVQGEFAFSGKLQSRYPIPRKQGDQPVYKLRHLLTAEERDWNVKQLRKSAYARQEHADALEAEGQARVAA